jgi:hypothetical protein
LKEKIDPVSAKVEALKQREKEIKEKIKKIAAYLEEKGVIIESVDISEVIEEKKPAEKETIFEEVGEYFEFKKKVLTVPKEEIVTPQEEIKEKIKEPPPIIQNEEVKENPAPPLKIISQPVNQKTGLSFQTPTFAPQFETTPQPSTPPPQAQESPQVEITPQIETPEIVPPKESAYPEISLELPKKTSPVKRFLLKLFLILSILGLGVFLYWYFQLRKLEKMP